MLREMKSVSIIFIFIFFPHESLNFGIVFKIRILFVIVDGSLRVVFFFFLRIDIDDFKNSQQRGIIDLFSCVRAAINFVMKVFRSSFSRMR